jgi:hypothetical protein
MGELVSPIASLTVEVEVETMGTTPWFMSARKLQRFALRVVDIEGTRLSLSLKLWGWSFILTSLLALLSSLTLGIASSVELNSHAVYHVAKGLLILTSLIAAFSMGALVQKVGSYGVVRLLRLFWLRSLRKHRTEVSSGGTVSHTVTKKRK